jgi:hypothetical protein
MTRSIVGFAVALAVFLASPLQMARAQASGAGLVIRHGDGRIVYRYVQFGEAYITGLELLRRSGLQVVSAPYPGLGEAVCAIDGEGCPAEDCFCKSYGSPSLYWNYYYLGSGGQWTRSSLGAANRRIVDGDVDGWSWTSGAPGLPTTSVDKIAAMFNIVRAPNPSLQPTEQLPTIGPSPTVVPTQAEKPTPTAGRVVPSSSVTTSPSPTTVQLPSPTATQLAADLTVTLPTAVPQSVTPSVAPAPSPAPTATASQETGLASGSYLAFGAIIGFMAALIGLLWWRTRVG